MITTPPTTAPRRSARRPLAATFVDALEPRRVFAAPWGSSAQLIGLDSLATNQPTITGAGQTIAIIDTGIDYTNPSLGGSFGGGLTGGNKVIGGYDFVDGDADPMDTDGHGTAVAGVAAADQFETGGFTYRGIAPGAKLVALRVAADTTAAPVDRLERALQWVVANAQTYGITVVNLSFGFGSYDADHTEDQFSDELSELKDMGIAFVASSGNGGVSDGEGITYPAADPNAYSVGSVNASDVISEFTQRSSNLDLLAVGENVRSTKRGGGYASFSGTSFAAPAVAGAFALARQVDSSFALGDVASMLRASGIANKDGDGEIGTTSGLTFQRLDVDRLVTIALQRKSGTSAEQAAIGVGGARSNLAVDPFGVEHFVYYDDAAQTMKYAVRNLSGSWSSATTIDDAAPNVGTEFSLKLDANGLPRVAYLDGPNGDLKFATYDDAAWTLEVLDSKGVVGIYPSLAIGSDGTMYVAYLRKTNADLKFTMKTPGQDWRRETVDDAFNVGYSATLALDNAGKVGIAYGDETNNKLLFAKRNDDGTWAKSVVDPSVNGAAYLSLAYNASNRPRISYYEVNSADLKFAAAQSDDTWQLSRLASKGATGLYTNLRIDDGDLASIYYWDRRTDSTFVAAGNGANTGSFTFARLASGGRYLSSTLSPVDASTVLVGQRDDRLVIDSL